MQETEYRKLIQTVFDHLERAFENVDPDVAECSQQFGALTIQFADQSRCILSAQPSVRQLWLALASKGVAYHFNFDSEKKQWWDDKGQGVELIAFLQKVFQENAGLKLNI